MGLLFRLLTVMYSLPYSFDFHTNWLAVSIHGPNEFGSKRLFDTLYYEDEEGRFSRKQFYYRTGPAVDTDDTGYQVTGNMGTAHKSTINIVFENKNSE